MIVQVGILVQMMIVGRGDKMSVIRIEDPDGNLMKMFIFTDDEDTVQEEDDDESMINDPDDGSWEGR